MKSTKLLFTILTLIIMTSYGCSDDSPTNTEPIVEPPTAAAFKALQDAALDARTQTAQFNAQDGISFTSESGVVLTIPGGCLALNGIPATGPAKLEYIELFHKSDMLVTDKPTMGLLPNKDKKVMASGGAFRINVYQNGEALDSPCHYNYHMKLAIPGNLTGGIDSSMTLWNGHIDTTDNLVWSENNKDSLEVAIAQQKYYVVFEDFCYSNVDHFKWDARPQTTLQVRPPKGYNAKNAAVYLSYDGEENVLANLDRYDEETGLFSEHYGQVPIGLNIHLIFVTEDNGQFRYAIKGVTVAKNDLYTFTLDESTVGSKQDLTDAIKVLP